MKPYTLKKLDDQPVVVLTVSADYQVTRDMPESRAELNAFLDTIDEPVFYILDLREASFSLDDIIRGASMGGRGSEASWHHPKLRRVILISGEDMVKLAAKGLSADVFGNLNVSVYDSLDKALAYVNEQA
ncbi:MAG: hypothetical protein JW966_12110 [Anaerolineae bacterium]|nr:hypothetical protein [Anaerolineae bacterium]